MKSIITADIHIDPNPDNAYRMGLFDWLGKQAKQHAVDLLIILGDLTVAKDRHSAPLVNFISKSLCELNDILPKGILIVAGNHDYVDSDNPFFGFTSYFPGVLFINKPLFTKEAAYIPSSKNMAEQCREIDFSPYKYIFTHATFAGIKTESGFPLPGLDPGIFGETNAKIYSGDIHAPQVVPGTNIEYIGAPYRTNYGDTYIPRVLMLDQDGSPTDLHFPCPNKHLFTISTAQDLHKELKKAKEGDHVKVRVKLHKAYYPEWVEFKDSIVETIEGRKLVLYGAPELVEIIRPRKEAEPVEQSYRTPEDVVRDYAKLHKLDLDTETIGLGLLK